MVFPIQGSSRTVPFLPDPPTHQLAGGKSTHWLYNTILIMRWSGQQTPNYPMDVPVTFIPDHVSRVCESVFQAWGQSREQVPGPLENSSLDLASSKTCWRWLAQIVRLLPVSSILKVGKERPLICRYSRTMVYPGNPKLLLFAGWVLVTNQRIK